MGLIKGLCRTEFCRDEPQVDSQIIFGTTYRVCSWSDDLKLYLYTFAFVYRSELSRRPPPPPPSGLHDGVALVLCAQPLSW